MSEIIFLIVLLSVSAVDFTLGRKIHEVPRIEGGHRREHGQVHEPRQEDGAPGPSRRINNLDPLRPGERNRDLEVHPGVAAPNVVQMEVGLEHPQNIVDIGVDRAVNEAADLRIHENRFAEIQQIFGEIIGILHPGRARPNLPDSPRNDRERPNSPDSPRNDRESPESPDSIREQLQIQHDHLERLRNAPLDQAQIELLEGSSIFINPQKLSAIVVKNRKSSRELQEQLLQSLIPREQFLEYKSGSKRIPGRFLHAVKRYMSVKAGHKLSHEEFMKNLKNQIRAIRMRRRSINN